MPLRVVPPYRIQQVSRFVSAVSAYDIAVLLAEELQISESLLFDDFSVFIDAPYTELLHTVRKRYGLNQVDFAQKAGISTSIYAKWESGSRRPSRKMYQHLKAIYPEI